MLSRASIPAVGVDFIAPVIIKHAVLCIFSNVLFVQFFSRLLIHTVEPYVSIGLTVPLYNHSVCLGCSPHLVPIILLPVLSAV